ncbi:hypothetical protein B0H13DRAFT_2337350 [Mycena leptocephala]|nr:hypothetical protein B0H13DRAFT_2337350 [Mycena leptocephala]
MSLVHAFLSNSSLSFASFVHGRCRFPRYRSAVFHSRRAANKTSFASGGAGFVVAMYSTTSTHSTYSQIVTTAASTGPQAPYERQPEQYILIYADRPDESPKFRKGLATARSFSDDSWRRITASGSAGAELAFARASCACGLSYANQRQIRLSGGSTLPAGSPGRLLNSDGTGFLGGKTVLEVLTDYVNRRRMQSGVGGAYRDVSFAPRGAAAQQPLTLRVEDVGLETDGGGVNETVITDALDLVRSLIQDNPAQAEQLMLALEAGEPVVAHTMTEAQPPDLVQLTTMILEEALSSTHQNNPHRTQLITSAMSVLSAILALPRYAHRVWLYVRSTAVLFGADRTVGFASVALASERVSGRYTMTLALLNLVQQLALEASSSILPDNPRLQQLKEEVLLRAIRFVHTEIWVEHLGWKYAQKAERFDIGRQVMTLYGDILENAPSVLDERAATFPFAPLLQSIADLLLFKATTSTINPMVSSITNGLAILDSLYDSRLLSDVRRLIFALAAHLPGRVSSSNPSVLVLRAALFRVIRILREGGFPSTFWRSISDKPASEEEHDSALDVATNMLEGWNEMWELNPQLLASVLRFVEVVWQHGLEHRGVLEPLRERSDFWERISMLACSELGPLPEYETESFGVVDGIRRSSHHEVISMHAYRTLVKSYALKIIAHDIGIHFSTSKEASRSKPPSFAKMEPHFKTSEDLGELLSEASPELVRSSQPVEEREFGDDFAFSTALFRTRLHAYRHKTSPEYHDSLVAQLHLVNMNLSLSHSQTTLADSWQLLLRKVVPYLDATVGSILMTSAASISYDIAAEKRSGDMMATIHGTRLSLLLAVLEVVWFSTTTDKKIEVESFVDLVHNVHNIILNEAQPPSKSFLGAISVPFHRTLLLILYFCAKNSGIWHGGPSL